MPEDDCLEELLGRLAELWRRQGAPIADHLAAGCGEADLHRLERDHGLTFPAELRTWWGWHDGVERRQPGTRLGVESLVGVGPWEFLSCREALDSRALMLRVAGRAEYPATDDDWDGYWRPSWLPVLAYDAHMVFVDVDQDHAGQVPVRVWDAQPDDVVRPRVGSWTDAVALWVNLIEGGYYTWSADRQVWTHRRQDIPEDALATGLV